MSFTKSALHGLGLFVAASVVAGCAGGSPPLGTSKAIVSNGLANTASASETVLHSFRGSPDGEISYSNLLAGKNGEFYGTTNGGGAAPSGGDGTVFEISASGAEKILYSFQGGDDGISADAGLIADSAGVLYGVTEYGGAGALCTDGCGTVFELTPSGAGYSERVLYAFQGGNDGAAPIGNLLMGKHGVLYGTTDLGGGAAACVGSPSLTGGCGTVFELIPSGSNYTEKILYSFQGGKDGALPADTLADANGVLFGTTQFGGGTSACAPSPSGTPGCGIAFKVSPSGKESIIYRFQGGANDGGNPRSALLLGKNGALYGAAKTGGKPTMCGSNGCGAAFELTPSGQHYVEHVLHFFGAVPNDALVPYDQNGLYADAAGNLYGTTSLGGDAKCQCGAVFEISPSSSGYTESVPYSFKGTMGNDGSQPHASLSADATGALYGTTAFGGHNACKPAFGGPGCGTVFKLSR